MPQSFSELCSQGTIRSQMLIWCRSMRSWRTLRLMWRNCLMKKVMKKLSSTLESNYEPRNSPFSTNFLLRTHIFQNPIWWTWGYDWTMTWRWSRPLRSSRLSCSRTLTTAKPGGCWVSCIRRMTRMRRQSSAFIEQMSWTRSILILFSALESHARMRSSQRRQWSTLRTGWDSTLCIRTLSFLSLRSITLMISECGWTNSSWML